MLKLSTVELDFKSPVISVYYYSVFVAERPFLE